MDLQLKGKLALVTGSTAGIGLAIAKVLAGEGARVIVNGRTEARVTAAIAAIRAQHPEAQLQALPADLSTESGAAQAIRGYDRLDILINNVGTYQAKPFEKITDQEWE